MRWFWVIVGVLAVITVVMLLRDGKTTLESVSRSDVTATPRNQSAEPVEIPIAPKSDVPASQPIVDTAAELAKDLMASAESGTAPLVPSASQPASPSDVPPASDNSASNGEHNPTPAAPKNYNAQVDPAAMELAKNAKIETQPDGSVLIDNKFTVRGSGSAEDPYQLSWDLLISASETYQPRLGLTQVPQRVNMLNGKHVKITGYMAFPLAQMEAKEVLVMLNMWDGCCIGIPPSPYDAIEVQLKEAIPYDKRRFINYGALTGVMKVDPYLVNDWLLGLYLVEDAKLDFGL